MKKILTVLVLGMCVWMNGSLALAKSVSPSILGMEGPVKESKSTLKKGSVKDFIAWVEQRRFEQKISQQELDQIIDMVDSMYTEDWDGLLEQYEDILEAYAEILTDMEAALDSLQDAAEDTAQENKIEYDSGNDVPYNQVGQNKCEREYNECMREANDTESTDDDEECKDLYDSCFKLQKNVG